MLKQNISSAIKKLIIVLFANLFTNYLMFVLSKMPLSFMNYVCAFLINVFVEK